MEKREIVRAWRDPKYRRSLSPEDRAKLPCHPAESLMGVEDDVLAGVTGGCCLPPLSSTVFCSAICSPCPPLDCY